MTEVFLRKVKCSYCGKVYHLLASMLTADPGFPCVNYKCDNMECDCNKKNLVHCSYDITDIESYCRYNEISVEQFKIMPRDNT